MAQAPLQSSGMPGPATSALGCGALLAWVLAMSDHKQISQVRALK